MWMQVFPQGLHISSIALTICSTPSLSPVCNACVWCVRFEFEFECPRCPWRWFHSGAIVHLRLWSNRVIACLFAQGPPLHYIQMQMQTQILYIYKYRFKYRCLLYLSICSNECVIVCSVSLFVQESSTAAARADWDVWLCELWGPRSKFSDRPVTSTRDHWSTLITHSKLIALRWTPRLQRFRDCTSTPTSYQPLGTRYKQGEVGKLGWGQNICGASVANIDFYFSVTDNAFVDGEVTPGAVTACNGGHQVAANTRPTTINVP